MIATFAPSRAWSRSPRESGGFTPGRRRGRGRARIAADVRRVHLELRELSGRRDPLGVRTTPAGQSRRSPPRRPRSASGSCERSGLAAFPRRSLAPALHPARRAPAAWLLKPRRSGGGHGTRAWRGGAVSRQAYLQQRIRGVPGSVIFLADGRRVYPLGITRQLVGERAFGATGFRYCGSLLGRGNASLFDDEARAARGRGGAGPGQSPRSSGSSGSTGSTSSLGAACPGRSR